MSKENEGLQEIADLAAGARTIRIGSEDYELEPLTPGDLAQAHYYLTQRRTMRFIEMTSGLPLGDQFAKGLSLIQASPIGLSDLIDDRETALKMIHLSLLRAGKKTITLPDLTRQLEPVRQAVWMGILFRISGLEKLPEVEDGVKRPSMPPADTTSSGPA